MSPQNNAPVTVAAVPGRNLHSVATQETKTILNIVDQSLADNPISSPLFDCAGQREPLVSAPTMENVGQALQAGVSQTANTVEDRVHSERNGGAR